MRHQPFDQIVTEHGPTVLRVCRAALGPGGADTVDDAWSETFLAALRAYPDLPADTNMQAWLVRVAHRKAIDQHRARARRPVPLPADEMPDRPGPASDGLGLSLGGDSELWDALAALPDKQRFAVAYHHLAGMPYAEVGELLGNSEAAARRAASDGVKALRKRFGTAATNEGAMSTSIRPRAHPATGDEHRGTEHTHSPSGDTTQPHDEEVVR